MFEMERNSFIPAVLNRTENYISVNISPQSQIFDDAQDVLLVQNFEKKY